MGASEGLEAFVPTLGEVSAKRERGKSSLHKVNAVISGLALVVLVVAAGTADRTGPLGAVALALASLLWLALNKQMEGAILWQVSAHHGLTAADLAGFVGLGLAAWHFLRP